MALSTLSRANTTPRRMLGVRASEEERRLIAEAAEREHRSVSSFVLRAALEAAKGHSPRRKTSQGEVLELLKAARSELASVNLRERDPLAELLSERRSEADGD